jgi:hypothetical protein
MLDSSRRLRMDDRRPSFPLHDLCGQIGSTAVPIAADVQHSAELDDKLAVPGRVPTERLPTALERQSSHIVYCSTEQQVSEGFAIALRAMGVEANFYLGGIAPADKSQNKEDD